MIHASRERVGEALRGVGLLLPQGSHPEGAQGVSVWLGGPALSRGLILVHRVRAQPVRAALAPWERPGWEHAVESCHEREVTLRAVRTDQRAAWLTLQGRALRVGEGALRVRVTPEGGEPRCSEHWVSVHARADRVLGEASALGQGCGAMGLARLRATLRGWAREGICSPGARVRLWAHRQGARGAPLARRSEGVLALGESRRWRASAGALRALRGFAQGTVVSVEIALDLPAESRETRDNPSVRALMVRGRGAEGEGAMTLWVEGPSMSGWDG
ncbi:MAG: hypothetical protein Q8Q09_09220 [Deltaproteobacteria bacterium]|nr:hypothetical protein [Deltaproteobacteria bacterium]